MNAASYPFSSVGILQTVNELNFTPKMLGGAMVGLQSTVFKDKLKSRLNGVVQLRDLGAVAENAGRARRRSSPGTRSAPRPKASIRSVIISAVGVMPISRCSPRASRAPRSLDDAKIAD